VLVKKYQRHFYRASKNINIVYNGRRKQGRVEECGGSSNGLRLNGKTKLFLDVGLAVVQQANPLPSTSLRGETQLGCFYVTSPPEFIASSLPNGWSMALRYNGRQRKGWTGKIGYSMSGRYTYSILFEKLCHEKRKA
jgi:hypothetical protein